MLRKIVCAVVIVGLGVGLAAAEELKGRITKIEGGKVYFAQMDKETKKVGEAKAYELAKDAKVSKMDGKDKKALADGLKAEELAKIGDKGTAATINVEGGKVTEIIITGGKKKKDAK